ncbi:oxysterol-binding protein [Diaporthe helianthi]|uniref:Oxysterol-binding protein n=1 Tax=Diaporthe helianthi TaxID=158607 RepID=A0A2P5HGW2_DIAHE|nr:oxysterol-binding protein [Diaporthe helianthi]
MGEDGPKSESSSSLKDFLASIASIKGDLSNITAPPFVLDTKSVVELPAFWAERPSLFVAPSACPDPAKRALLVLRWFLSSLRNQQYGGRSEDEGVRKPLNAFLGELFLAKWQDTNGETTLVAEQVSHHPPVTACRVWNEQHGVFAEGFTRQEITLGLGNIAIKQLGHALLTLREHGDETYLIPLPDVKVRGLLSGLAGTYPELEGTYTIPCTSGYYSVVEFSGKSLLGSGARNEVSARIFGPGLQGAPRHEPLYTVAGHWNESFTIYNGANTSKEASIETVIIRDLPTTPMTPFEQDLEAQDPWESRRAWQEVRDALQRRDMADAAKAKSAIEQGQRAMRKKEAQEGNRWEALFFRPEFEDQLATRLYRSILKELKPEDTVALWKFNKESWTRGVQKPFHGQLLPSNVIAPAPISVARRDMSSDLDDTSLASPASFKTAPEYIMTSSSTQSGPDWEREHAVTRTPPVKSIPPTSSARQSVERGSRALTPSPPSVSPSTRGKRQRARESVGKFRKSLSSGLSKITSPGRSASDSK